jgi:hypothetical protein
MPGGLLDIDAALEPGDRVALIAENLEKRPEMVVYYTILPGGEWREDCRRPAREPPPDGIEWPRFRPPPEFEKRMPPRPAPQGAVPERDVDGVRRTDAP